MEEIRPGTRILTLDTMALPFNLMPLTEPKKTVEVEGAKYYKEDFALYALRTVVGNVFIDENGNGEFDAGEEGIADAQLAVEDNLALTDDTGRYFLKRLKGGMQKIELDPESLPDGYKIKGDPFKEVMLAPEGEIKEDVNFPVIR